MNRVKEYYEAACIFSDLPEMARYIVGTHFSVKDALFHLTPEVRDAIIFKDIVERNLLPEFQRYITHYGRHEYIN